MLISQTFIAEQSTSFQELIYGILIKPSNTFEMFFMLRAGWEPFFFIRAISKYTLSHVLRRVLYE